MSLVLADNGTVTFDLEGTKVTLRRPTLGEYRDVLREPLDEIMDTANDALDEINAMAEASVDMTPEEQRTRIPEARKLRREIGRKLDDMRIEWFRTVCKVLGPTDLNFDEIEVPVWALDSDLAAELVSHWRTRPGPPSGGQ